MNNLEGAKEFLLDILFPKKCANCGGEGSWLCEDCASLIEILESQYCPFCSHPGIVLDGKTCASCRKNNKLAGLFCVASFENKVARNLIYQFKYEPHLAKYLAQPLSSLIITHLNLLNKNALPEFLLVPIPLHKKKLKRRGFNQALELAKHLAIALGCESEENVLVKNKETLPQMEMPKEKRFLNISGAFECRDTEKIKGKKIMLVDDVFTTGATMEECATQLLKAGAKEVWGVVIARG